MTVPSHPPRSGSEHRAEAKRLLRGKSTDYTTLGGEHVTAWPPTPEETALAQVHAILALVEAVNALRGKP